MNSNKDGRINIDFNVPFYIFEDLIEYVELTAQGKPTGTRWEKIRALLGLAKINERLTEEQVKYIEDTYCREKISLSH
ncbi:MAG: hypothetical protein IJH12_10490 [Clostridia bacterium]|nr:hypothetical protein [Clostridia bacterium]